MGWLALRSPYGHNGIMWIPSAQAPRLAKPLIATLVVLLMVGCAQPKKDRVPEIPPLPPQQEQPSEPESRTPPEQETEAPSQPPAKPSSTKQPAGSRQTQETREPADAPPGELNPAAGEGSPPPPGRAGDPEAASQGGEPSLGTPSGHPRAGGQREEATGPARPQSGAPVRGPAQGPAGTALPAGGEQTEDEIVDQLDRALQRSLGDFDEVLRREAETARRERPHSATGGKDKSAGGGTPGAGTEVGEAQHEQASGTGSERPGETDTTGGGQGVSASGGSGAQTPQPVPRGSDDDIVARQLREAAEQESDPQLKKRLWEEYRKYKEGR